MVLQGNISAVTLRFCKSIRFEEFHRKAEEVKKMYLVTLTIYISVST